MLPKNEPIEIPNTDYKAIKSDEYTKVLNERGVVVACVPSHWSLFALEEWLQPYIVGYSRGLHDGEQVGRIAAGSEIQRALSITSTYCKADPRGGTRPRKT